jgi:hypothetical protein
MKIDEYLSQAFLLIIVAMSLLVAWEFYKSKDGMLRILIISLFIAKVWVYGGAFVYYQLADFRFVDAPNPLLFRLVLNFPMLIVMVLLYRYIRTHNK